MKVRAAVARGETSAPGSKSVTHRAFLLAAQSREPCTVRRPLIAHDTVAMLDCLRAMGARVAAPLHPDAAAIRFEPTPLRAPAGALDCRNAGTALRLLAATAARLGPPVLLTGDGSTRLRPNGPLLAALQTLGAKAQSNEGRAPLRIQGPLRSGIVSLPGKASSQFASALLLALPFVAGDSTLELTPPVASRPYLDVTLSVARQAGLQIAAHEPGGFAIAGGQTVAARTLQVDGDWSAAAFPLAAAAVTGGAVRVRGLDPQSAQGDRAIVEFLRRFGADVRVHADGATCIGGPLTSPGTVDVMATPDLFPVLAAVAAVSRGTTTLTGAAGLRAKESDRIEAMAQGLSRLGATVQPLPEGLRVTGSVLRGATLASRGDHRIHMALHLAALAAAGASHLDGGETAAISYPGFHADMARLTQGAP